MTRLARTGGALACFIGLALLWTFPLVHHGVSHIPGDGPGDNVGALWNFWWTRFALTHELPLFHTRYLFAPAGTSLGLHAQLAVPALVGATVLGGMPLLAAHNVLLIVTLALNGLCASWLLRRETGDGIAALLGGAIFAGSPFVAAHLHGHFNVLSAWSLPLVCLAARAATPSSRRWAVGLGAAIGLTAYLDYYYALYAVALAGVLLLAQRHDVRLALGGARPQPSRGDRWLIGATLIVAAVVVPIAVADGLTSGPPRPGLGDPFNGLQILWLLVAIVAWRRWRPRLSFPATPAAPSGHFRAPLLALGIASVVSAPLGLAILDVVLNGDYVSQTYPWRSGVQGVDLATVVLGPPFHWIAGWPALVYDWRGIDTIERSAWMGVVPLGLALAGWRFGPRAQTTRWLVVGGGAFLWALGPHLTIFGWNSGLVLPNAVLRYLPVLSNARVPGRTMVIVFLAVAVLSAFGIAELRRRGFPTVACVALAMLLLADLWPGRFPLTALERSPLYESLRMHPASGTVLELPMGLRDGFGETGRLDHRTLWYQTIHERPITGGFVARLPPSTERAYADHPLLSTLLALSASTPPSQTPGLPDGEDALRALRGLDVRFIVLNRETAPPALVDWVDVLRLARLGGDDFRDWFLVGDPVTDVDGARTTVGPGP